MSNAKRARGGWGGSLRSPGIKGDPTSMGQNPQGHNQQTSTQPYGPITSAGGQNGLREAMKEQHPTEDAVKSNRWGS